MKNGLIVSYKIFITPPSLDELKKRLENRQSDSKETIQNRVETAAEEIKLANQLNIFNKLIINKDKDIYLEEVKQVVEGWYPFIKK